MSKVIVLLLLIAIPFVFTPRAYASSDRAYQDYLFQSDVYRQKYNEFTIAKNEYLKFKTLTSEATAISKTKEMLSQRSLLLRGYLLLLNEKLSESTTISDDDKKLYQTLISNEVSFLENHSKFVESIATLADAVKGSNQLESHYVILSTAIRQIIIGITVGRLTSLGNMYSAEMVLSQMLLNGAKSELTLDRQITLDRWFQKISDKRTIYLQKIESINQAKTTLKATKVEELDVKFRAILTTVTQAKQELTDGTSYMNELLNAMRFKD